MGGKVKQSQRTKNNARPASSGRSAVLLSNAIFSDPTFNKAGAVQGLFPSMMSTYLDQGLSNEFSVAFKKLNKKDPITRIKALQELIELVNNTESDNVVEALPAWSHQYQVLTLDSERKVRALTQVCHGEIVSKCGRRVAPHLRRILPAWLLALHDEHGPAQAAADASLNKTFPGQKLVEAITFCKTEVLSLITDIVTGHAEDIISVKFLETEERVAHVSRVVSGALRALRWCEMVLPRDLDSWLATTLRPVLADPAFWKLPTHPEPHVRGGWYSWAGAALARGGRGEA
ncbi:unnamed protein product, partial [Leptidea sinapis]